MSKENYRVVPADIESEKCVLGSLMLSQSTEMVDEIITILSGKPFHQVDHQIYFDAMLRMRRAGSPIDAVLLKNELTKSKLLIEVGGVAYIAELLNTVPSAAHGVHYAKVVREKYKIRELIKIADDMFRSAYDGLNAGTSEEIAGKMMDGVANVINNGGSDNIITYADSVHQVIDEYDSQKAKRIKTGIGTLDALIGGVPLGKMTLVGARPRVGKSQLIKQWAINMAEDGETCGLITIEENRKKIGENAIANYSGVENNKIAYARANSDELSRMLEVIPSLSRLPIFISDTPVTIAEVESTARMMITKHKCRAIFVDYLQLIDPDEESNENRELTKISKSLKRLFKHYGVAGVVPCQLNRKNETMGIRKPALPDLRGSGSIEADGDLIILLHREDVYHTSEQDYTPTNQLEMIIAKNKDGPSGMVPAWFSGKYQAVTDWNGGLGTYHLRDGSDQGNIQFK